MSSCCRSMFNVITSAVTFYAPLLGLGIAAGTKMASHTCNNIKDVGFAALESLRFDAITQGIQYACNATLGYSDPVVDYCKVITQEGLGPFKKILSKEVVDLIYEVCPHSGELERICSEINSIGFAAFEKIGPLDLKKQVIDACSSVLNDRKVTIALVGFAGYFALYFTIRGIYRNQQAKQKEIADSVCDKNKCKKIAADYLLKSKLLDSCLEKLDENVKNSENLLKRLKVATP